MSGWYEFRNAAQDTAELLLYGDIGGSWDGTGVAAEPFVRDLAAVKAPKLTIRVNSLGGSVRDGIAMYNALRAHPAHKTMYIEGWACSAASFVAMAGDRIRMAYNATMMIHNSQWATWGDANMMQAAADVMRKNDQQIAETYAARGNKSAEEYRAMMDAETWMTADEAVAAGLCDEIDRPAAAATATNRVPMVNSAATLSRFSNTPASVRAAIRGTHMATESTPTASTCTLPDGTVTSDGQEACEAAGGTYSEGEATATASASKRAGARPKRPATLAELKATFPQSDATFRERMIESGATLDAAKDAWIEQLTAKADAASERAAKAEAQAKAAAAAASGLTNAIPTARLTLEATEAAPSDADAAIKAEWNADAAIRAEFRNNYKSYAAVRTAERAGRVRITRGA